MTEMQNIIVESDTEKENDELDDDVEMDQHIVTSPDEVIGSLDFLKLFIE